MKKTTLFALSALALTVHTAAHSAEHRLAFSKAHNVEVFANETNNQWCQPQLDLRFVFGDAQANLETVENLLPKLGVLFAEQCPSATSANWQALNQAREKQAEGTTSKEHAWLMQRAEAVNTAVAAAPAAETSNAEAAAPATATAEAAETVTQPAAEAPTEAAAAQAQPAAEPVTEPAPVAKQASPVATEPQPAPAAAAQPETVAQPAEQPAQQAAAEPVTAKTETAPAEPVAEPAPVAKQASPVATEPQPAPAAAVQPEAVAQPAQQPAEQPVQAEQTAATEPAAVSAPAPVEENFSVNGWQPADLKPLLSKHKALHSLTDQNGCALFISSRIELSEQSYSVQTDKLDCVNGYAQGTGSMAVVRSDGAHLVNVEGSFVNGFPVSSFPSEHIDQMPLVQVTEDGSLIFSLLKDTANQQYYLMQAKTGWRSYWELDTSNIYLLTERADDFRQQESIKNAVMAPVPAFSKMFPRRGSYSLTAQHTLSNKDEDKYYSVYVEHGYRSKVWSFNPNRATNYLFRNEARAAEEAKRAAERKAYEERLERERIARQARSELEHYQSLRNERSSTDELVTQYSEHLYYSKEGSGHFSRLLAGAKSDFAGVVYINRERKGLYQTTYPFPLNILPGEEHKLAKGWYYIKGVQTLNTEQLDSDNLPVSEVVPTTVTRCESKACADLFTPLNRTRLKFSKPEWTPEEAQQLIEAAAEGSQS